MDLPALLSTGQLEQSTVVANNRMNRERGLRGVNSYQKELGSTKSAQSIDILEFLTSRTRRPDSVRWVDLCCGTGNALIQAAGGVHDKGISGKMRFEGVDLAGLFSTVPNTVADILHLRVGSVFDWTPNYRYDLITCIHGIHYLGDKLGILQKAMGCLKTDGQLIVNLDPDNLKDAEGKSLSKWWKAECRRNGWKFKTHRHLLQVVGPQTWPVNWKFLGADDQVGPNYSGQPAIDSYYAIELYAKGTLSPTTEAY